MKIWVKLEGVVKNSVSIDGKRDLRMKLERRLLVGKKISSGTKCEEYYGFQYQGTGGETACLRGCDGY